MKRFITAAAFCCLMAPLAAAADAKVEAAIKTFGQVESDAGKLKTYCDMSKAMADAGDDDSDQAKMDALDKQMDGYIKSLGADFEAAWDLGADIDSESADGKAYEAAIEKLESKCSG